MFWFTSGLSRPNLYSGVGAHNRLSSCLYKLQQGTATQNLHLPSRQHLQLTKKPSIMGAIIHEPRPVSGESHFWHTIWTQQKATTALSYIDSAAGSILLCFQPPSINQYRERMEEGGPRFCAACNCRSKLCLKVWRQIRSNRWQRH